MVEIEGERVLAASCQRKASQGLVVKTDTDRAEKSRRMVFEIVVGFCVYRLLRYAVG